jgi:hypothetical protein
LLHEELGLFLRQAAIFLPIWKHISAFLLLLASKRFKLFGQIQRPRASSWRFDSIWTSVVQPGLDQSQGE